MDPLDLVDVGDIMVGELDGRVICTIAAVPVGIKCLRIWFVMLVEKWNNVFNLFTNMPFSGVTHGWVGVYICAPEYRGHGYGLRLWRAAVDAPAFRNRILGLDGVCPLFLLGKYKKTCFGFKCSK